MPQKRDPKTNPKAFLGKRLRLGRISAGFTSQDALAARLGFDRSVVAKAETGDRVPTGDVLAAWCEACELDLDLFTDMADLAHSGDGPVPTWFEDYLEAERAAESLLIWSPIVIPGPLQTADYARVLFIAAQTDTSDDAIEALVNVRLDRQRMFERADPPDVAVVLDEAVLHRLIGSPTVMHDALIQVAELAVRPNLGWRTSSYTGNGGGNCVEVAGTTGAVLVRDTKDRKSGTLTFTSGAWASFTASLR